MDLTRGTPAALMAALFGPHFYPIVLAYVDWPGAPLRAHSGKGSISFGGHDWTGVGKFGSIDIPDEVMHGIPDEFSMSLVSDLEEMEVYTDTVFRGRQGAIWLGATQTPGGNDLIGAVEMVTGVADGMGLKVESERAQDTTVTLFDLRVSFTTGPSYRSMAALSHSHEDQIRQFPGDTAGRHLILAQARAQKTLWPEP